MPTKINWLHLSDLHHGQNGSNHLWPTFKTEFFRDLRVIGEKIGGWDVVFFTGDFVQKGTQEEYSLVSKEMEELWKEFDKISGSSPVLIAVPGNHDLLRPDENSPISLAFEQWHQKESLRNDFWENKNSEYRLAVSSFFSNYSTWLNNLQVKHPQNIKRGLLPGDFSVILNKENESLGVVGLNTSFLQIRGGEFRELLDISSRQLNSVCENSPDKWLSENGLNLLLTHHPASWLSPSARSHFRQEIDVPGRFFAHLCGHQHEAETSSIAQGGSGARRLRQAPSLFGLTNYGDRNELRTHGYFAGQFTFSQSIGIESFWPRDAIKGVAGNLRLRPDQRFDLSDDGNIITQFDIQKKDEIKPESRLATSQQSTIQPEAIVDILNTKISPENAEERLRICPKLLSVSSPEHLAIRQEEQTAFELAIRQTRAVWLTANWLVSKEEFIASTVARFKHEAKPSVFHLRCSDAENEESLQTIFVQQFGMALQVFGSHVAVLENQFLIFDDVPKTLLTPPSADRFIKIINAILAYCPRLSVIIVSEEPSIDSSFRNIEIGPLPVTDVRAYILAHPNASDISKDGDTIERIYISSDGLPARIDEILKATKVSSLKSVLEEDFSVNEIHPSTATGGVPRSVISAVNSLFQSQDKTMARAGKFLKVLSLLPFGETLEAIKHFFPAEPFFSGNVISLSDRSLVEVVPLGRSTPSLKLSGSGAIDLSGTKLLKVPRPVRDYVKKFISDADKDEIMRAGLELYFGRNWRAGKIKLRSTPVEYQEYLDHGLGNEFALVNYLIRTQTKDGSEKRGIRLGIYYLQHLKNRDRYRDLSSVAEVLIGLIHPEDTKIFTQVTMLYGHALRMTGNRITAVAQLHRALETGEKTLSKDEKANIWIEIAFAADTDGHSSNAISAAKKVLDFADEKSARWYEAQYIIACHDQLGDERIARLRRLERDARKENFNTIGNNIALNLLNEEEDESQANVLFDRILTTEDQGYTRWRAIISKAEFAVKIGKIQDMDISGRRDLVHAYAYLHGQRMGNLFNRCHDVVWSLLETEKNSDQILRLFYHSSFLWRIRGEDDKESAYAKKLAVITVGYKGDQPSSINPERIYLINRLKSLAILMKDSLTN